jgi:hypothetical protein
MPDPRQSDTPRPGYYLLRLVRGGPWVAAQVARDPAGWRCMIDGTWEGPAADPWSLRGMETIHWSGRETTAEDCQRRIGLARWAKIHEPDHPAANPRRPIDLDRIIPI